MIMKFINKILCHYNKHKLSLIYVKVGRTKKVKGLKRINLFKYKCSHCDEACGGVFTLS